MMSCRKYKKWISLELDGKLSPKEKEQLEHHIEICEVCSRYREDVELIQRLAMASPKPEVPPGYFQNFSMEIKRQVQEQQTRKKREPRRLALFRERPRWLWALPLAAAFLALIFYFYPRRDTVQQVYLFSPEEVWPVLISDIGGDPEVSQTFNEIIEKHIQDFILGEEPSNQVYEDQPVLIEELTEDELRILLEELWKNQKGEGI